MVIPAAQSPEEGLWFSADVVFATLTVSGAAFQVDIDTPTVGSSLDLVLEAVQTRGTVIGLRVTSATVVQLLIDYAQAYASEPVGNSPSGTQANLLDEVEALIDANSGLSSSAFSNVGTDFTAG
jgi:hypothetical protein